MIRTNIEEYIKALKGKIHTNKISVVLYDEEYDIYHYISKIRRNANECEMLSVTLTSHRNYTSVMKLEKK